MEKCDICRKGKEVLTKGDIQLCSDCKELKIDKIVLRRIGILSYKEENQEKFIRKLRAEIFSISPTKRFVKRDLINFIDEKAKKLLGIKGGAAR